VKGIVLGYYEITEERECEDFEQSKRWPKTETNGGTPFSLSEGSLLEKEKVHWWAGPDLNRRPSPREGDVLWPFGLAS
jgi:hypothetical protein